MRLIVEARQQSKIRSPGPIRVLIPTVGRFRPDSDKMGCRQARGAWGKGALNRFSVARSASGAASLG